MLRVSEEVSAKTERKPKYKPCDWKAKLTFVLRYGGRYLATFYLTACLDLAT